MGRNRAAEKHILEDLKQRATKTDSRNSPSKRIIGGVQAPQKEGSYCSVTDTVANRHLVTKEGIDTEGHNLSHIRGQRGKDATDKLSSTENRRQPTNWPRMCADILLLSHFLQ